MLITSRHHACEMMASYVLEGAMAEVLADSEASTQRHLAGVQDSPGLW